MQKARELLVLREKFEHMGSHSGYDLLCRFLESAGLNPRFVWLKLSSFNYPATLILKILRKLKVVQSPWYKGQNLWAEVKIIHKSRACKSIIHILYGENNLGLLSSRTIKGNRKLAVTIHQPACWWKSHIQKLGAMFNSVDALIVLSREEQRVFSEMSTAAVYFIPHGVDTSFFVPPELQLLESKLERPEPRCLFVGQWFRDFHTLHQVVSIVSKQKLSVHFDIVVPKPPGMDIAVLSLIEKIEAFPCVSSHQNLDDFELLAFYQNANFLVLPLEESTANNSILEALSCGLPIITTMTSGVVDYVDHGCARVCAHRDAIGVVEAIKELGSDPGLQQRMSEAARRKAVSLFSWECVSKQVTTVYQDLANRDYHYP